MIEILSTGALNSVQDTGRFGYLNLGVAQSGAMDATALAVGNLVLGNEPNCAALEVAMYPFKIRFTSPQTFAVAGADCRMTLGDRVLPPQWICHAQAGETLTLQPPRAGVRSYICFAGGLDVPLVMGSRATDLKSALGGLDGRGLKRGDNLAVHQAKPIKFSGGVCAPSSVIVGPVDIRVSAASEYHEFSDEALQCFFTSEWTVTQESNRMGIRLAGPNISPRQKLEMLSHGILPGTIQVPPAGQPIVQMADANTCGGYPKIGNVIDVDIGRLAQRPVGSKFRFVQVTHEQALQAQLTLEEQLYRLRRMVGTSHKTIV